ncbi:MAG TPA: GIDE domain-containing protein [Sandaracinaceae bacterium LLY-WYZ-13_1]|nr:GIDE domain-containing protein [Sandaracinaceae bacterium LLY-WYZ-13_1]
MWVTLLVVVGSVLLVVSGFSWAARREEVERVRRLSALEVGSTADARPGRLLAVRGAVRAAEAPKDPVTGEKAAFWELRVVRADGDRTLHHERRGRLVRVDDGDGALAVELEGAEIDVPMVEVERHERIPSETMRGILESADVDVPEERAEARYALFHRALAVGDTVTAVGVPRDDDGTLALSPAAGLLWVTPGPLEALQERERRDVVALTRLLAVGAVLGAFLVAVGAAIWLADG